MEVSKDVVMGFEAALRKELQGVVTLAAFAQETSKLLGFMGFSDFSFFNWTSSGEYLRSKPKLLIKRSAGGTLGQAVNYLVDAVEGRSNKQLLKICYEETSSLIDSPESAVRQSYYRLVTRTGNYAFFIRKGGQTTSSQQVLSIVDKRLSPNQFRKHIVENKLALDTINRVVEEIGVDRFPELFTVIESESEINLGVKPLHLLNILALENITVSQAAVVLGISVDTANKYIAKIKFELGVSTLPSMMFHAVNKGLIDRVI